MNTTSSTTHTLEEFETARKELSKLPLLGPVLWLYARDPQRKFTFIADLDWRLLPPLIHDQCHLYSKQELPWAFFTWAFVSDEVDQRLRKSPLIAPHEWRGGPHAWLIDIVTPFGDHEQLLEQTIRRVGPGQTFSAWVTDLQGKALLREFKADA